MTDDDNKKACAAIAALIQNYLDSEDAPESLRGGKALHLVVFVAEPAPGNEIKCLQGMTASGLALTDEVNAGITLSAMPEAGGIH
jgi:hypothetical protein